MGIESKPQQSDMAVQALLQTIKEWPREIYDIAAVIVAVHSELDKTAPSMAKISSTPSSSILMECLAELWVFSSFYCPNTIDSGGFASTGTQLIANQGKHCHTICD